MKIISLLPAATEMVYLLGLEKSLMAVSDDCDYPTEVKNIPKITTSIVNNLLSSKKIDQTIKKNLHKGNSIFHLNKSLLSKFKPDLILSQELCTVCAIGVEDVKHAVRIIKSETTILSFEPESINNVFANITTLAEFTDTTKIATQQIRKLEKRMKNIKKKLPNEQKKQRVVIVEWLDPLMIAAHWVPEMVENVNSIPLLALKGKKSKQVEWQDIMNADPDVLIIAPCGFSVERTKQELSLLTKKPNYTSLKAVRDKRIFLMDGNAYLTRPGPRIVDGIEIFAEILYPEAFARKHGNNDWCQLDN